MITYSCKNSKSLFLPLRATLVFFVSLCSLFLCFASLRQIIVEGRSWNRLVAFRPQGYDCGVYDISPEESQFIHFPQPNTFSRAECRCNPVRLFAIISMQRSGSGWFETLLNSHPNISSNGEIFAPRSRRANISAITTTLNTLYNLDWLTSAAKNDCTGAFGLKWMTNQGFVEYSSEILQYLNNKGVLLIFLFRRNHLRRLISLLANEFDRHAKQFNGTHKSHVHSREEAEILAKFKPKLNASVLLSELRGMEKAISDCLNLFNSTRHIVLFYEDVVNNENVLRRVQEFLGVPVRNLSSQQVKIHTHPVPHLVENWEEVQRTLNGTEFTHFLNHTGRRLM